VRLALEVRRRVKEQQKRIGAAEFRNTHFSYTMGAEGVEKFVSRLSCRARAASATSRWNAARSGR
jgi:ATP-dependent Lon protease